MVGKNKHLTKGFSEFLFILLAAIFIVLVLFIFRNSSQTSDTQTPLPVVTDVGESEGAAMRYGNLYVTVPENALSLPVRVSLIGFRSPNLDRVDGLLGYQMIFYLTEPTQEALVLQEPLGLRVDYSSYQDTIDDCGYDESSLSFYYLNRQDYLAGTTYNPEKIVSTLDIENKMITAEFSKITDITDGASFNALMVGASPSKYIFNGFCGEDSYADFENGVVNYNKYDFSFVPPDTNTRPIGSLGLVAENISLTLPQNLDAIFSLRSYYLNDELATQDLDEFTTAYEGPPSRYVRETETVVEKSVETYADIESLRLESEDEDSKILRIFMPMEFEGNNYVHIFEAKTDKNTAPSSWDQVKASVRNTAFSVKPL